MAKFPIFFSVVLAALVLGEAVQAKIVNVKEAPSSALGDGSTDDRPAFVRAFSEAEPGDTVLIPPGSYRIILTGAPLIVPEGVTLWGQSEQSKFLLTSNEKASVYREFLRPKSDVTVEGLTIARDSDFTGILLPISGDARNITFRNCHIIGAQARFPKSSCHAIRVGFGIVKNLVLEGVAVEDCCYGLFQPNDAKGTLDGVTVRYCRFERNAASDLEFNSPNGVMRNILVRDCYFRDNLSATAGGGFAVGFANVANGRVENCLIQNYGSEALHVEDRSTEIELIGNTIIGGSLRQGNGVILVVNHSKGVKIQGNFVDARLNKNSPHLVLVTAGGKNFANPSDVTVMGNVFVNGESTRSWYLQGGSGPEPSENLTIPASLK